MFFLFPRLLYSAQARRMGVEDGDKPEAVMTALAKLRKFCRGLGIGDF